MTAAQLKRRIDYWTKLLWPLGLQHWDFAVTIVEGEIEDHPDAHAVVDTSDLYDCARFTFRGDVDEWEDEEVEQIILHELVHVLMRDFDETINEVGYQLASSTRTLWDNTVRREREGVVERLARTIWTLHER